MRTTELKVGQRWTVFLRSNPTTGYSWRLAEPLDTRVIELIGTEYQTDRAERHLVGSGGKEAWTFRATGPGKVVISLEYVQLDDIPPAEQK